MNIMNYFWPENNLAKWLVCFLVAIFIIWFYKLLKTWKNLGWEKYRSRQCINIDDLAVALDKILGQKKEPDEDNTKITGRKKNNPGDEGKDVSIIKAGSVAFTSFCREKKIYEEGIVARHLRAIYNAGLQDSRLDVGELIKNTANELFKANSLLKSLLSSFLVIGLLGTLLGLADSLFGLSSGLSKGLEDKTSASLASGLSTLFTNLKTAFAPSIWGVGLTVIGVIFFSFYLHRACYPLKNMIEKLTLTVWVPRLFLTESQRYLGTLRLGGELIQDNMKAIDNLIDMQKTIKPDVDELTEKLKTSNQTLGLMNESGREMQNFTGRFVEGVTKLSSFQDQINALYQKMVEQSEVFQQRVKNSIENSQQFQVSANTAFEKQNRQLQESYQNLDSYEKAYVEQRKEIDEKLKQLLDTSKKAYENLSERNKEVLEMIGKPLNEELEDIKNTLIRELTDISKRFNSMYDKINEGAEMVSRSFENFDERTKTLPSELRSEFTTQQENINKGLQEFFKKIEILTKTIQTGFSKQDDDTGQILRGLAQRLEDYGADWQKTAHIQAEQSESLGKNLSELSDSINELPDVMVKFENFFKQRDDTLDTLAPLGKLSDDMSSLICQLKEDSQTQKKYNTSIEKSTFKMANAVEALSRGIGSLSGREIPIARENPSRDSGISWDRNYRPFFDFAHSPIINFLRRFFRRLLFGGR